jgi:hypothetical protein
LMGKGFRPDGGLGKVACRLLGSASDRVRMTQVRLAPRADDRWVRGGIVTWARVLCPGRPQVSKARLAGGRPRGSARGQADFHQGRPLLGAWLGAFAGVGAVECPDGVSVGSETLGLSRRLPDLWLTPVGQTAVPFPMMSARF